MVAMKSLRVYWTEAFTLVFKRVLVVFGTVLHKPRFSGNSSPEVKALLKQPHLQDALSTAPADLVKVDGKIATLLRAYKPNHGLVRGHRLMNSRPREAGWPGFVSLTWRS